jgi:hypothetical protein
MKIIYLHDDNTLACIVPAPEILRTMTIEQIAKKDVPTGKAYKIIEDNELPSSREFRNAWTINESELTDGVGD